MALRDTTGEPVSTANRRALELFDKALLQYHSYFGDPVETIDQALAEDPDFVLGHVFRATMFAMLAEAQFLPEMRASVEAAERLDGRANARERGLTQAARYWLDGDWDRAARAWDRVLVEHPQDAFALQSAHLSDFYRGEAVSLRDRVARVLPRWERDNPSYSYVLGMYAFGLEECNEFGRAEETAHRALAIEPRDGWSVHALGHVLEMQGRYDEGIDCYTSREQDWAPDNGFAFHNWWHLALYHIERKEYARVLEIFDTCISPEPSDIALTLLDATALLWRLHLTGVDVGDRWRGIAGKWAEKIPVEAGHYAFNDMHAAMAFAAEDRLDDIAAVIGSLEERAADGNGASSIAMSREVGLPVCKALLAFAREDYERAVRTLLRVRPIAHRFGGSNAQRDVLSQTLLEAAIRGGYRDLALHLVNERTAHKAQSPLAWRYLARAQRAAGDAAAAERAAAKADAFILPRGHLVA